MIKNNKLLEQFLQAGISNSDIEDLLSNAFIIIDDLYKQFIPKEVKNRPGPDSQLSDSEIMAITYTGELLCVDSENAWYAFVKKHFSHLFRYLPHRTRFNRRRRNLWKVTDMIRRQLLECLPYGDILIVDSLPVPICDFKRAYFSKSQLKSGYVNGLQATYGHCATKDLGTFLGFCVHLVISQQGLPLAFAVANADIDDRDVLPQMIAEFLNTIIIGDKGYVSESLRQELHKEYGIDLLAQKRSNQKNPYSPHLRRTINRLRKRVEVTNNQLEDQFNLSKVRARTHWGLLTRISDKFAAFTLGAFINHLLGQPLLVLKSLAFG
jgi:IS5 family transposase